MRAQALFKVSATLIGLIPKLRPHVGLTRRPNATRARQTNMALPPKFKGARLYLGSDGAGATGAADPVHTIEIYLDYVCPFSASKSFQSMALLARRLRCSPHVAVG